MLDADAKYFRRAYRCIYEVGVKLGQTIWRKLLPQEAEQANDALNTICLELLRFKEWDLAIVLLEFAANGLSRFNSSSTYSRIFKINLAQAYKWNGEDSKCKSILDEMDWCDLRDKFLLANAVLRDDFDEAAAIMARIGPSGEVPKEAYPDWPIFRKFRTTSQFHETYKRVFSAPFQIRAEVSKLELIEEMLGERTPPSERPSEAIAELTP